MTALVPQLCLRTVILGVSLAVTTATAQTPDWTSRPTPSPAEQEKLLNGMRQYAAGYLSNLPNFICLQITQQFQAGKKANHWHKGDSLTSRLVFNEGREERTLQRINERPIRPGTRPGRTPLTTEGEFGILLSQVFGESSEASFLWNGWDAIDGREVVVFDYSIDKNHSTLSLSLSDLARAVVPYHGSVYADPVSGAVWRITNSASDIPPEVQTKSISTTIDYGEVAIAGATYLLPTQATVLLSTGSSNIRNQMQFTGYRKFEADSTITYDSDRGDSSAETRKPNDRENPPNP